MEVILGMPWLSVHNPEIDWEKKKVKITQYPPICGKKKQEIGKKEVNRIGEEKDLEILKRLVPEKF